MTDDGSILSDDNADAFASAMADSVLGGDSDDTNIDDHADAFASAMADAIVGGEAVSPVGPAAADYLERRIAQSEPALLHTKVGYKSRDWQVDSGPVFGPAGGRTTVTLRPQCIFHVEKLIATDTGSTPGQGTRVVGVIVGQKLQRPANGATLTKFLDPAALANGIDWDTSRAYETIAVEVSFIEQCTFDITLFGKAAVEE